MTQIDTIIFDLDGTLVDTELAAARAIHTCFDRWNIKIDPTDASYITGRTWENAFEFLFKKYQLPLSANQASEQMIQTYRDSLKDHLQIVPGSAQAVRSLASTYPLGLVSGSHRSEIFFALDHLGVKSLFHTVLGAEDYPNSKPAPDGYLKALQLMQRDPARTLIFEDSTAGIASALAAGAWVVAISGTNHTKQDTSLAHHHIADLSEVNSNWVAQLASRLMHRTAR